jgi:hypothetical protein
MRCEKSNDLNLGEFATHRKFAVTEDNLQIQREETLTWISEYAVQILRQEWGSPVSIRPQLGIRLARAQID